MNLNYLPIIGWLLSVFFNISLAIPFWFLWTYHRFGNFYFYWLPDAYKDIPFFNIVALFIIVGILKSVFLPSFSCSNECGKESK